jgi:DNA (cytosine-5)-methyltransferase 1
VIRYDEAADEGERVKLVSLYTGCGGLDLGLEAAGFETRVCIEMDGDSVRTLRAAKEEWPVIERDIHEVPSEEILEVAGAKEGEVDLLSGGPPCQPFSKSGYWARGDARRLEDPRATTLEAYLRVLRDVKPRAFLLENVAGLAYQNKDEGLQLLEETIESINREMGTRYSIRYALLNAADYGVPQERERVFMIGHREGRKFRFPAPTHTSRSEDTDDPQAVLGIESTLEPYHTAWDALGDLEEDDDPALRLRGRWADLLPSIPEGKNYLHHTERGEGLALFGWRRRYWSFLLKLAKRRTAWTITAQPGPSIGPFHWKSRRLSMRELARLQTFPDEHQVLGSLTAIHRQIGNAVPSALAELLGLEIRRQLLDDATSDPSKRTLLPPYRTPVPDPEPVAPVPEKYHRLIGEHEAHPGTGKGYGALARSESP